LAEAGGRGHQEAAGGEAGQAGGGHEADEERGSRDQTRSQNDCKRNKKTK
jgi:hypothetical protein